LSSKFNITLDYGRWVSPGDLGLLRFELNSKPVTPVRRKRSHQF